MLPTPNYLRSNQSGFILIEVMIVIAIVGILAFIAVISYQTYIRKAQIMTVYQEINHFRMPYQILISEGAGVTGFSPSGLNIPSQTENCQLTVVAPNINTITPNAIICQIQNLNYLDSQTLSLDLKADGTWQCRASSDIPVIYLPLACQ